MTWVAVAYAVAGLVAGLGAALGLVRPRWLLLFLIAVELSNLSGLLPSVAGVSVYLCLLALTSICLVLGVVTGRVEVRLSPALFLLGLAIAGHIPAVLSAADPVSAWSSVAELVKDWWLLVVVVLLGNSLTTAWTMARVLAVTLMPFAALTLVNQFLLGNTATFGGLVSVSDALGVGTTTARHSGPVVDPNFWGRLLVLSFPLALAAAAEAWQRRARREAVLWLGGVAVLAGGIYLTQSRGAMLAAAVAGAVFLFAAGSGYRRLLVFAPLLLVALLALPGIGSRLATLTELTSEGPSVVDYSLAERAAVQQVGAAIFADNPAFGVGPSNIPLVWEEYAGRADLTFQRRVAPHNLYLQLGAETGIVGLAAWLVFFLGVCTLAARIVWSRPAPVDVMPPPERLLAAGALASLCGWAVASIFLHLSHLGALLLVVAVVAVLDLQTVPQPLSARQPPDRRARTRRRLLALGLVVALGATAAALQRSLSEQRWVAQVSVRVFPASAGAPTPDAYRYDLLSRDLVLPTYAAIYSKLADDLVAERGPRQGVDVSVIGRSTDAVLVIEARGDSRDSVTTIAERVAERGGRYVNGNASLSFLAEASTAERDVYRTTPWATLWGGS